jgi:Rod binding domain-containing protein
MLAVSATLSAASGVTASRQDRDWQMLLDSGRISTETQSDPEFLRFLCRQLEALAINSLFEAARRTIPQDGPLSGGFAGVMFQGMADEENARQIAAGGGFGVGDELFRQMTARKAYSAAAMAQRAAPVRDASSGDGGLVAQATVVQPD